MKEKKKRLECGFTPYNPENPDLQTGDEGNFKSKDTEKLRLLGGGYTGFTLVEIVIVVLIIGLLVALVGPRFIGRYETAKLQAAKAQIELFGTALDAFRLDTGKYPTTEEGLKALREKPSGVEGWQGPYLPKELPDDPWKNPYIYRCPGEHGEYDLISYGADRVEGGEGQNQDVVSWKDISK